MDRFPKLGMYHWGLRRILVYSNYDDPGLALTYFTARSNFATQPFIWENVTMRILWKLFSHTTSIKMKTCCHLAICNQVLYVLCLNLVHISGEHLQAIWYSGSVFYSKYRLCLLLRTNQLGLKQVTESSYLLEPPLNWV